MEQHQRNAFAVAHFLESSPYVTEVIYPGLPSHPQHQLACRQQSGFGGMISFRIKGDLSNARRFFDHTALFALAESLGGVESLSEIPYVAPGPHAARCPVACTLDPAVRAGRAASPDCCSSGVGRRARWHATARS